MSSNVTQTSAKHSTANLTTDAAAANGATDVPGEMNVSGLTAEGLMAYLATRLRGIDDQVNAQFEKQNVANQSSAALSDLQNAISPYVAGTIKEGTDGDGARANVQAAFQAALQNTKDDPTTQAAIKTQYALFLRSSGMGADTKYGVQPAPGQDSSNGIDSGELKGYCDALSQAQKDLNSGSELGMIGLQTLMSQRQTAVQMSTSCVQSVGDTAKSIAEKIGQ